MIIASVNGSIVSFERQHLDDMVRLLTQRYFFMVALDIKVYGFDSKPPTCEH